MEAVPQSRNDSESPKRQAILDAAATLFMTQGYGAVSMDAIARAAGVSKATLYAHFESKDRLFATIVGDACRQNMSIDEMLPDANPDLEAALTALGRRVLHFLLEDRALAIHRVVIAESARFPELGKAFFENGPLVFSRVFGNWLRGQTDAGRLSVSDPEIAAHQFVGLLRSGAHHRATLGLGPPPSETEIETIVSAAVRTFLHGYAA